MLLLSLRLVRADDDDELLLASHSLPVSSRAREQGEISCAIAKLNPARPRALALMNYT
jgi:hypothetical protein